MFWVWAILLLVLGLGLAMLEVFFPSAGILGFLATCAIVGSVVLGFQQSNTAGFTMILITVIGVPGVLVMAFRVWPHTAVGRRVLLMAPDSEDVLPEDPEKEFLKGLVGRVVETKCKMLPAGAIVVDGRTIDAVSEGTAIEQGQRVRVIEVKGNRVVVRALADELPSQSAADPLRRPIDAVADDPFEDGTG